MKLAFKEKRDSRKSKLRVVAPKLPARAVPGVYRLFVVGKNGVPSVGKQVRLLPETRGEKLEFR